MLSWPQCIVGAEDTSMGLLDSLESLAANKLGQSGSQTGSQAGDGSHASIAGGLLSALEEHPGGLGGLMTHMQANGVDPQAVANGQPTTPQQVDQGLAGSGIIEKVAARAGVSPEVVKIGLATVLPIVMAHFTQGGTAAPPSSGFGGAASQILGRFL